LVGVFIKVVSEAMRPHFKSSSRSVTSKISCQKTGRNSFITHKLRSAILGMKVTTVPNISVPSYKL
jgi:hypothetical protein